MFPYIDTWCLDMHTHIPIHLLEHDNIEGGDQFIGTVGWHCSDWTVLSIGTSGSVAFRRPFIQFGTFDILSLGMAHFR